MRYHQCILSFYSRDCPILSLLLGFVSIDLLYKLFVDRVWVTMAVNT
jgi:hypothetical protein